jgi:hypothetical protein
MLMKDEDFTIFVNRIRTAFYRMPRNQNAIHQVRALLVEKLSTYTSSIWRNICHRIDHLTTAEMIEAAA